MSRALVLNAGASWCAYQVGALRHLGGERELRFDLCAGTGFGAMSAAFVACGQFAALEDYWSSVRLNDLIPFWRRRFMAAHVSEEALAERGTELIVTAANLQTGHLEVLRYPGCELPLVDGLLAAGALPGITRPVRFGGSQLVEGTVVDGVPMGPVLAAHPSEIVAVLAMLPDGGGPRARYRTWRAVMRRSIEANQAEDSRLAMADVWTASAECGAYRAARERLAGATAGVADGALAEQVEHAFEARQPPPGPRLIVVRPSRLIDHPLWRFRRSDLARTATLGEQDARAAH